MEGDPTSFEEAMRSNGVCDLEKIPKWAKTVGCK
jgi:hypothetical protein